MIEDPRTFAPLPFDDDSDEGTEARQLQRDTAPTPIPLSEARARLEDMFLGLPYDGDRLDRMWADLELAMEDPNEHIIDVLDNGSSAATNATLYAGEHGDLDRAAKYASKVVGYNSQLLELGFRPQYSESVNTAQYLR